jgi:hypothetical protein
MKTQTIAPWKVKAGMRVVSETMPREYCRDGAPRAFVVLSVEKRRGWLTGASVWRVKVADPLSPLGWDFFQYHGSTKSLPAQRVLIEKGDA